MAEAPSANSWNTWGAVGHGAGPGMGLLTGLYMGLGPGGTLQRKTRSYNRQMRQSAVDSAIRSKEGYLDKSKRDEQYLQQEEAGRGLGMHSSIPTEDTAFFGRARDRALAEMDQNIRNAQSAQSLQRYEDRVGRINQYIGYFNQLAGTAGGIITGGLG